jgi:hypothetical protein
VNILIGDKKMKKTDICIKIPANSSNASVTLTEENGKATHKSVTIDGIVSVLTSSVMISTGLLPTNTRFYSGSDYEYVIGIQSPPLVRRLRVANHKVVYEIPFPVCLFIFHVKNKSVVGARIFSAKNPVMKEGETLSRFPFGNTYKDGKICWGEARLPKISTPVQLSGCVALFFDAPFNGDLIDNYTINKPKDLASIEGIDSIISYLNGKDFFPQDMLYNLGIKVSELLRSRDV